MPFDDTPLFSFDYNTTLWLLGGRTSLAQWLNFKAISFHKMRQTTCNQHDPGTQISTFKSLHVKIHLSYLIQNS